MSTIKIRKVGNSLGVIFPKDVQDALNITEGDMVDVTTIGRNKVILDSHLPHHSKWTFEGVELNVEDQVWIDADLEDENEKAPRW